MGMHQTLLLPPLLLKGSAHLLWTTSQKQAVFLNTANKMLRFGNKVTWAKDTALREGGIGVKKNMIKMYCSYKIFSIKKVGKRNRQSQQCGPGLEFQHFRAQGRKVTSCSPVFSDSWYSPIVYSTYQDTVTKKKSEKVTWWSPASNLNL